MKHLMLLSALVFLAIATSMLFQPMTFTNNGVFVGTLVLGLFWFWEWLR